MKIKNIVVILLIAISISFPASDKIWTFLYMHKKENVYYYKNYPFFQKVKKTLRNES